MDLISVSRKAGRECSVRIRAHALTTDMSVREGGQDAGPSPIEMLGCSLGACMAMMVQGYCDHHGYTDGQVEVSLTMELADSPKRIAAFVVDLTLPGDVPDNRIEAIRRVAEQCPVHATLAAAPRLDLDITRVSHSNTPPS